MRVSLIVLGSGLALSSGCLSHPEAPGISAARAAGPTSQNVTERDLAPLPPDHRQSVSPNGRYLLVVQSGDGWRSRRAQGRLLESAQATWRVVWERELPQEYGPRYLLVGDDGQVALFDEWNNVESRYAIVVINFRNGLERVYAFDSVAKTLGLPRRTIVERAKSGWWLEGPPRLDAAGKTALIATAGQCLVADLDTGHISAPDPWPSGCRPPARPG